MNASEKGMNEFIHQDKGPGFDSTSTQTEDINRAQIETTEVEAEINPTPAPDLGLAPVQGKEVKKFAEEGREVIEALNEANAAMFNADKEKADIKNIQNADRGVVSSGMKIVEMLAKRLSNRSEALTKRAEYRKETVSKLEQSVLSRRYQRDFGTQQAEVESSGMKKMLSEISGANTYYSRGPEAKYSGIKGFFKKGYDSLALRIVEGRYNRARKDVVTLTARSQYARAFSKGLEGIRDAMKGLVERTELKATETQQENAVGYQNTINTAQQEYGKLVG